MTTLTTYRGIVRDGKVIIQDIDLPDGVEVIVVAQQLPISLEAQKRRLSGMSQNEWQRSLDDYDQLLKENPAESDMSELSDEEIVTLVHETREAYRTDK